MEKEKYKEFYAFVSREKKEPPLLDGRTFGKYKNGSNEQKNLAVQHLLSKLFCEKNVKEQFRYLEQLKKVFPKNHDFEIDIRNWIKALSNQINQKGKNYEEYKIIRSSNPYVLFRIGSIAGESCQRVTGDPSKNKCLLAYPCDGKNQVIYAQNKDGKIESRAILRFFYACNQEGTNLKELFPVLYLEPLYPSGTNDILRKAITLSAVQCANQLKVPLVRHLKKTEETSEKLKYSYLKTINGPSPFEYFDGLKNKIKNNDIKREGFSSTSIRAIDSSEIKTLYDPDGVIAKLLGKLEK